MAAMESNHQTKELVLTREAVRGCDTAAIERYAMEGIVLMENAGGAAARYADGLLGGKPGAKVCVLAGTGNNGGMGLWRRGICIMGGIGWRCWCWASGSGSRGMR